MIVPATFKIIVNQEPFFSSSPVDQTVVLNKMITYTLPSYSDTEGQTITVESFRPLSTTLPAFVTFSSNKYTIAPKLSSQVGVHAIQVVLTDSMKASAAYNFNIIVEAPPAPASTSTSTTTTATTSTSTTTSNTTTTSGSGTTTLTTTVIEPPP